MEANPVDFTEARVAAFTEAASAAGSTEDLAVNLFLVSAGTSLAAFGQEGRLSLSE